MKRFALAVHGGAGPDSDHIHKNIDGYKKGIEDALNAGYAVLEKGGSAVDAVEAAVNSMENNPLFNAGRGGALNEKAESQMCASIADGKRHKFGAIAIVKNVKNPVSLAKAVMEKTSHIYLGGPGALSFAQEVKAPLEPDAYFITEHQYESYAEVRNKQSNSPQQAAKEQVESRMHGTVGAVALDAHGNLAAATSTGGTEHEKEGRIGDSSMIGVGTYANNNTCAISTTGDGEYAIKHTVGFHVSAIMEYKGLSLPEATQYFMDEKFKGEKGDIGLIAIDGNGQVSFQFQADRMHRGCRTSAGEMMVEIY
jgi:beta-aspartyl-peptidase (threonine type)